MNFFGKNIDYDQEELDQKIGVILANIRNEYGVSKEAVIKSKDTINRRSLTELENNNRSCSESDLIAYGQALYRQHGVELNQLIETIEQKL